MDENRIEKIIELLEEKGVEETLKSVGVEDVSYLFAIGGFFWGEGGV
ncbi:MAG: hypothetical protein PVF58_21350 [Candidatus Methanofastidiosia archaeon]